MCFRVCGNWSICARRISIASALRTGKNTYRAVGFYNSAHDLICFARQGDVLSATLNGVSIYQDAAPRHHFNDTKHHRVTYRAVATSRFRDYFTPTLDPVVQDVQTFTHLLGG